MRRRFENLTIVQRLTAGFGVIVLCIMLLGALAYNQTQTVGHTADTVVNDLVPASDATHDIQQQMETENTSLVLMAYRHVVDEKVTYTQARAQLQADYSLIAADAVEYPRLASMIATQVKPQQASMNQYMDQVITAVLTDHKPIPTATWMNWVGARDSFDGVMQKVFKEANATIAAAHRSSQSTVSTAGRIVVGFLFFAVVAALILAVLIARSIGLPLRRLASAAQRLAGGDTAVATLLPPTSKSETGQLSDSIRAIVAYQEDMVQAARSIAGGDLTQPVQPRGEQDTLGRAFVTMTGNLEELVGDLAAAATNVDNGAGRLAESAQHVGQAGTQIAKAIEEVARGASEQSKGSTEMLEQMKALNVAVLQVTEGVDDQRAMAASVVQSSRRDGQGGGRRECKLAFGYRSGRRSCSDRTRRGSRNIPDGCQHRHGAPGGAEQRDGSRGFGQAEPGDRPDHRGYRRYCQPDEPACAQRGHRGRTSR